MHRKYTQDQVLENHYNYEMEQIHFNIPKERIESLNQIGNIFGKTYWKYQRINQLIERIHFKQDISLQAEISIDNWRAKLKAYKNEYKQSTENRKRREQYLLNEYNTKKENSKKRRKINV